MGAEEMETNRKFVKQERGHNIEEGGEFTQDRR